MRICACLAAGLLTLLPGLAGEVQLPVMRTPAGVYSNVTVTTVTPTDIFFLHAHGGGNAKLSDLSPDLQQRFGYDPAKAAAAQKALWQANAMFHNNTVIIQSQLNAARAADTNNAGDIPHPPIHARSFLNQKPPDLIVSKWLSETPDPTGKSVLVFFWSTTCDPCRALIPDINRYHQVFQRQLMVMGLSAESEDAVRGASTVKDLGKRLPKFDFYSGIDTAARTAKGLELAQLPYCLVLDPRGIVRYEGDPALLNEQVLRTLFEKYEN